MRTFTSRYWERGGHHWIEYLLDGKVVTGLMWRGSAEGRALMKKRWIEDGELPVLTSRMRLVWADGSEWRDPMLVQK